jgi:flagellar hook-length control protein FliK
VAARISVSNVSSAGRAAGSEAGNATAPVAQGAAAGAAGACGGFSSAMNAASGRADSPRQDNTYGQDSAQPQRTSNAATGTRATSAANASNRAPTNAGAASSDSSGSAEDCSAIQQAQAAISGAATAAASEASTIDSQLSARDASSSGSQRQSAGNDKANAVTTDPATLALLLAAGGLQINGQTGGSEPQGGGARQGDAGSGSDDGGAAALAAAGALAANVALSSLVAGSNPVPKAASTDAMAGTSTGATASIGGVPSGSGADGLDKAVFAALSSLQATGHDAANTLSNQDPTADAVPSAPAPATDAATTGKSMAAAAAGALPDMMSRLAAASAGAVERSISLPVSDRNWSGAVAGQVQWMLSNNVQSATLQLSPEHLGPVEVRIEVQSSQVNVSFSASHADTRAALEQTVPRLRELMASGGLTLGQTSVQQQAHSGSQYASPSKQGSTASSQTVDPVSLSPLRALGLVDEYA